MKHRHWRRAAGAVVLGLIGLLALGAPDAQAQLKAGQTFYIRFNNYYDIERHMKDARSEFNASEHYVMTGAVPFRMVSATEAEMLPGGWIRLVSGTVDHNSVNHEFKQRCQLRYRYPVLRGEVEGTVEPMGNKARVGIKGLVSSLDEAVQHCTAPGGPTEHRIIMGGANLLYYPIVMPFAPGATGHYTTTDESNDTQNVVVRTNLQVVAGNLIAPSDAPADIPGPRGGSGTEPGTTPPVTPPPPPVQPPAGPPGGLPNNPCDKNAVAARLAAVIDGVTAERMALWQRNEGIDREIETLTTQIDQLHEQRSLAEDAENEFLADALGRQIDQRNERIDQLNHQIDANRCAIRVFDAALEDFHRARAQAMGDLRTDLCGMNQWIPQRQAQLRQQLQHPCQED